MNYLLFIFLNVFLIIIFSLIAKKIKLVDVPNHRKLHTHNIHLIGGICMLIIRFIVKMFQKSHDAPDTTFLRFLINNIRKKYIIRLYVMNKMDLVSQN